MSTPIGISLNFDSLSEAYGFPKNYRDPSFEEGFERLAKLCANYNFPLTIFVVGRDLKNPKRASIVKEWANQGHEIANHSWSHHFNLGSLNSRKIRDEVFYAHEIITETIGKEPKGFIAPAWSSSNCLVSNLIELNYLYDTSVFPSLYLYPMVAKIASKHWNNPVKGLRMIQRKDWLSPLLFPNKPFYVDRKMKIHHKKDNDKLLILPLPTQNRLSLCLWHTKGFLLGWDKVKKEIKTLGSKNEGFYYLIHPADFLGPEDLNKEYSMSLARMDFSLEDKLYFIEDILKCIKRTKRPVKTLTEVAENIITRNLNEKIN